MFDGKAFGAEIVAAVKGHVSRALAPLLDRVVALERAAASIPDEVAKAIAAIPLPKDGKDGAPGEKGADGLPGKDGAPGRDGIDGKDGRDGIDGKDGRDGKDADPETVKAMVDSVVAAAMAAMPVPKDGRDGEQGPPGPPGNDGRDGVDGAPGRDGKDADPITREQIAEAVLEHRDAIDEAVRRHLEANPPKDGRDGRDGLPGVPGQPGEKGLDGKDGKDGRDGRDGIDGKDGLGFDDLSVDHDGERGIVIRFARGDQAKEFRLSIPAMIYRGVFMEGTPYQRGDTVTWAGSLWHCNAETTEKPGVDGTWTLAAKRGRDGKGA